MKNGTELPYFYHHIYIKDFLHIPEIQLKRSWIFKSLEITQIIPPIQKQTKPIP